MRVRPETRSRHATPIFSKIAMPTYVYKFIDTDETIEIQQSFTEPTLTEAVHPETGQVKPVKKVFLPVGVTFKGDGFYKTDSRSKKSTASSPPKGGAESTGSTTPSSTSSDTASSSTSSTSSTTSSTSSD